MTDLEELIKTAAQLSERLERMADDERRFGWEIGNKLEMLAYETFVISNSINEIKAISAGSVV